MLEIVFPFIGGLGMFLVGMKLLSDGLVKFAGGTLQQLLVRFTGTPFKAFASGALITALVQSSTATTVTLIGFVSAGLISFVQAIGVVIGASLGNTATGWIVAGLGLKINLGFYTLPLIGIGALLNLLARGRWTGLGLALAGFGLLFLGLNTLQDGMRGLSGAFSLASLPSGGYGARIAIMLIGLALTAVLQSSTAAIATTLTALHSEAISFDQAAAMVIGASIGTTLTGALVAIGGTIYAKRTALAYILFNLVTGLIAVLLLPLYTYLIRLIETHADLVPGALSLTVFHSFFIGVGVVLFLPFTERFAALVRRILPEPRETLTQHLDNSLLNIPAVALEASQRTLEQITQRLLDAYDRIILAMAPPDNLQSELAGLHHELDRTFDFVSRIPLATGDHELAAHRIAQLHAIDHLLRFRNRLSDFGQLRADFGNPVYRLALEHNRELLTLARDGLSGKLPDNWLERLEQGALSLAGLSRQVRHEVLQETGSGNGMSQALRVTDSFRWLERTGNHVWRICHYLSLGRVQERKPLSPEPREDSSQNPALSEHHTSALSDH